MALKHLYGDTIDPVEAKMKDLVYLTVVSVIQFFVEADALLRTPSETERNNDDPKTRKL